jgi:hypothetical protein
MLPFTDWPIEDRLRWEAAFRSGDLFDENGAGARLAAATRQLRLESYGRFLGFLSVKHPKHMALPPEERIDRRIAAEYVAWRRRSCGDISLAADLGSLCGTLKLLCPNTEWSWLRSIANRLAAGAPPPARKHNLVTSDRLYALGIELMDCAVTAANAVGRTKTRQAVHLYVTCYTEGFSYFVTSMTAPVASGWSVSPGGACTHWKAPPCHGAHPKLPFQAAPPYGRRTPESDRWRYR